MTKCSVSDCNSKHYANGYCRKHNDRVRKHGTTDRYLKEKPICKIDDCLNVGSIAGYCKKHYDKIRHTNKPISKKANHEHHIKYRYGITIEEYNKKLKEQGYVCAICFEPEMMLFSGELKRLAVDHCHKTNKVRDLLCTNCNVALGNVKDDIQTLKDMIEYLQRHQS